MLVRDSRHMYINGLYQRKKNLKCFNKIILVGKFNYCIYIYICKCVCVDQIHGRRELP